MTGGRRHGDTALAPSVGQAEGAMAVPGAGPDPDSAARPRWCLGTRLLLAATAAWVGFLTLHVVVTGRWWLWLAVEALPPVVLVLVPVALLALSPLARPVRRPLVGTLVLALVAGVHLSGVNLRPSAIGPEPGAVRVFSFNTDIWNHDDDPSAFFDYLRAQRADIYLLQEYLSWNDGPVRIDDTARLRAAFPGYDIVVEGELVTLSRSRSRRRTAGLRVGPGGLVLVRQQGAADRRSRWRPAAFGVQRAPAGADPRRSRPVARRLLPVSRGAVPAQKHWVQRSARRSGAQRQPGPRRG